MLLQGSHLEEPVWPTGFQVVSPNTYSIYKLVDRKQELVLQKQIQEHDLAAEDEHLKHGYNGKSLNNGLVIMVLQRPEA